MQQVDPICTLNTVAIVLAAGQGKRMNSSLPKVAHPLLGKPLLMWVIESLSRAHITKIVPVIAPTQDVLKEMLLQTKSDIEVEVALQPQPLGTGHAVLCGINSVQALFPNGIPKDLKVVIAYGDTPAIEAHTFRKLVEHHTTQKNIFTVIAFTTNKPEGYGRILTNNKQEFLAIREHKDCSREELGIQICNSGFLCGNYDEFKSLLPLVKNKNSAGEFYLTDIPCLAKEHGFQVGLMIEPQERQFLGVNTQEQLMDMEKLFQSKNNA